MSKNDIEPAGAQPIWPLATQGGGALALPQWTPQPAGGGILPGDLNLATLWRIVSEWRWLILGAVAVGLAGAVVITFLTTPLYRARATLEINPPQIEPVDPSKVSNAGNGYFDQRAYMQTQIGLLGSKNLAEQIAQSLNLVSNPSFVPMSADPARRREIAAGRVLGGLPGFGAGPVGQEMPGVDAEFLGDL